jgi:pantoate--beta-alanine ligase
MKIFEKGADLRRHIEQSGFAPTGFVPTMGALHNGHITLASMAAGDCPLVTVSIFVNPTQFNDKKDLERYPRTLENDIKMLAHVLRENDALFVPGVEEIYPEPDTRVFEFGKADKVMEGLHRKGHFNGVAQVVSKLFDIVKPDIAYFGQKDFQQLTIVRELVRQLGSKISIVACPIIREEDGLAMSSRNRLLKPAHRASAGLIYRSLVQSAPIVKSQGVLKAREFFRKAIESVDGFSMQYYEVVDDIDLTPVTGKFAPVTGRNYYICIALYAGEIRLIDNIAISLE